MNDRMKSTTIGAAAVGAFLRAYGRDPAQADRLAGAVLYYTLTGEEPVAELAEIDETAWDLLAGEVDRLREISARRAVSGRLGGSVRKHPEAMESNEKHLQATASKAKQTEAPASDAKQRQADRDRDIDIYKEKDKRESAPASVAEAPELQFPGKPAERPVEASRTPGAVESTPEGRERLPDAPAVPEKRVRRFTRPTLDEIRAYMAEIGADGFTPERFYDHYNGNGWMIGKSGMKDWKATIRNWNRDRKDRRAATSSTTTWQAPEGVSRRNAF